MLLLRNARCWQAGGKFVPGDILIADSRIKSVGVNLQAPTGTEVVDLAGRMVIPGLIDIHLHGALGHDVMEAGSRELAEIGRFLVQMGTTTYLPTTITAPAEATVKAIKSIAAAGKHPGGLASIAGVHIEGPYINEERKGCHDPAWIRNPNWEEFAGFMQACPPGKVRVTVAPEIEGGLDFIHRAQEAGVVASIGHSDGDGKTIRRALAGGAGLFTHLFNAMRGLHHREPGVAGTALVSDAYVELICDGIHVDPEVVELAYKLKGPEQIVLVTDAMQATGLGDGEYMFGGFPIIVRDGIARKEDGALASSTLTMFAAVKNMMKFAGCSLAEATLMAAANPARAVGIDAEVGTIDAGKRADLLVLTGEEQEPDSLQINRVFCRGVEMEVG